MKFTRKDFLWGGATAASQIEGAYDVHGKSLTMSDLDVFKGNVDRKEIGLHAYTKTELQKYLDNPDFNGEYHPKRFGNNFYERYAEDIKLLADSGMNIFRMSVAWARIYPNGTEEKPNQEGLNFYRRVIDECKKNKMEIMITINHFDLPVSLAVNYGGWANKELIDMFVKYSKTLLDNFGNDVKYWLPFNEINFVAIFGTKSGILADMHKSNTEEVLYQALHNQFIAQAKVIKLVKDMNNGAQAGCMLAGLVSYPYNCHPTTMWAWYKDKQLRQEFFYDLMTTGEYPSYMKDYFKKEKFNLSIEDEEMKILKENPIQFITFSYYMTRVISHENNEQTGGNLMGGVRNPFLKANDWGWQIDPEGLRFLLNELWDRYHLPMFISENGLGMIENMKDKNDKIQDDYRIEYMNNHFKSIQLAIEDGVDVFGYTMWAPVDLVSAGTSEFAKRYGLVYVDYDDWGKGTGDRFPKKSYDWFKNFMKTKELK